MSIEQRFFDLFKGNDRVHGVFNVKDTSTAPGKKKGQAVVLKEQTTVDHWRDHLAGGQGLGIVPIMDDNHCWWGAIDIDDYQLDHGKIIRKLEEFRIPCVVGRSKSGGGHLYFFFTEPIEAAVVLTKLKEIAARLGYAKSEIFPKQKELLVERGDSGNFLNMPYYSGQNTTRFAYDANMQPLSPEGFLAYAEAQRMAPEFLNNLKTAKVDAGKGPLPEGPPCLQHLCEQGFGEGSRNNALFNLGVYARMAGGDAWESMIHKFNLDYMVPPLNKEEVNVIIKQLERKEYFYKCEDQPINAHCNKDICLGRKFGVGPGQLNTELSSLTKINGDPPIWILNVDGDRVELSTDALVTQSKFQRECVAQINKYPILINQRAWQNRMQVLLDNLTVVEVPPDATLAGEFEDLLTSFCCERARGETREEILQGIACWLEGKVFLQIKDLKKHLHVNDFTQYSSNKITLRLQQLGAGKMFWRVKEKGIHVWYFPQEFFKDQQAPNDATELDLPPRQRKDVI